MNEAIKFKIYIRISKTEIKIKSVSGTGLAFIVFTEAINQFPAPQLWSVLFFLMLLTLGLDSMFGTLEGALTSINDMMMFPGVRKEIICGKCQHPAPGHRLHGVCGNRIHIWPENHIKRHRTYDRTASELFLGTTVMKPWPWWCQLFAAILILMALLWIPGVAICKYFNLISWKREEPVFFPSEELCEEYDIKEKKTNAFEKY
ncbi:S6A15-like protein, partial [Mya arenaria]